MSLSTIVETQPIQCAGGEVAFASFEEACFQVLSNPSSELKTDMGKVERGGGGRSAFDPQTSLEIAFTFGVTMLPKWANFVRPDDSRGDGRIGSNAISDNSP